MPSGWAVTARFSSGLPAVVPGTAPSSARLLRTLGSSVKVGTVIAAFAWLLADAAEEGKRIVLGMLVVGLIFAGVIGLGELSRWSRERKS